VEDIMRLIDMAGTATAAAYSRSDVVQALNEHQPAAVAIASGQLVGVATARMAGRDAHLLALALHPNWRNRGIGSALLRELDQEAIHHGALRMLALVEPGQVGEVAFAHQGFDRIDGLHFYIRSASMVPEELEIVERYGGHFPAAGLWKEIKGFSTTKELLERRIVAPLAHAELAESVGLQAPGAVMLFGPPGTGKTSFARAIASRLSWAFVELHPSLLGHGTAGAAALRAALEDLSHVDRLVCFLDEADEIASARASRPESQPIVNELLKAIPVFKSRPGRLMVMATNSIASIDPAMLRPGRFDLIIPIGAPDSAGRVELAAEFLEKCDAEEIAEHTEGFTPADFALAAQRAAQLAFERALEGGAPAVTSDDCADAVSRTRPSVHKEAAAAFDEEAAAFARL
jgi:GNAT superfamily N-acetyltransferase